MAAPSYLTRVEAHYRKVEEDRPYDIAAEVTTAKNSADVRTLVPLTRQGILHFSRYFVPVRNAADLDDLPGKLSGDNEFGFSPLFDPALVDECCQRGIFPLSHDIGNGHFIFSPKVHNARAVCALASSPAERNTISGFPFCEDDEGLFSRSCVGLNRKLLKDPDEHTRRPAFELSMNREEDLVDIFTLIRKQHGENWLCKALRLCFLHIFFNPSKYKTRVVTTAIRRKKYDEEDAVGSPATVGEGELVAGELGYVVGDIYSSASGAYCIKGGGALQLCLIGLFMRAAGCRVWDLGMVMNYKKELHTVELSRRGWLRMAVARRSNGNASILRYVEEEGKGCPVTQLLEKGTPAPTTDANSKAQKKKRVKAEAAAKRKLEQATNAPGKNSAA